MEKRGVIAALLFWASSCDMSMSLGTEDDVGVGWTSELDMVVVVVREREGLYMFGWAAAWPWKLEHLLLGCFNLVVG